MGFVAGGMTAGEADNVMSRHRRDWTSAPPCRSNCTHAIGIWLRSVQVRKRAHLRLLNAAPDNHDPLEHSTSAAPPRQSTSFQEPDDMLHWSLGGAQIAIPGKYLMYSVPVLWGSFGPTVRLMFSMPHAPDPALFNSARLLLASLVFLPGLVSQLQEVRCDDPEEMRVKRASANQWLLGGVELGLWVFLANVFQVLGLKATQASRAAFLNQMQTVIVPVLGAILGIERVTMSGWASAGLAVIGVAILSSAGEPGSYSVVGDTFELVSALFFSVYVLRVGKYAATCDPRNLVGAKVVIQATLSVGWILWNITQNGTVNHPVEFFESADNPWSVYEAVVIVGTIVWNGLMTSALSGLLQTTAQRYIKASETALILSSQPLWASAFAAGLLGEHLSFRGIIGGLAILLATVISSFGKKSDH
uniref:EamA domain-containing protein n=1 Tax=Compsopogon caeruleus TaxID=31354 RepID=A0A7S1T8V9_9RHOD|eukprot:CAMPEP_0184682888 /NCGR_PEP_ID=MMETSP0312-20130426/9159_1 /TAXON_ID=31354 /ORGANISM="Compsopogon coeruleus, Strain SAG 36.94" /LENGTH=417 /DNA_ID=CAMNT_0027134857 /DNA_START=9 /DNA_END=1262 /DNA_ORIENTATION=-